MTHEEKRAWILGIGAIASILAAGISKDGERDQRDREIRRFGEYAGHSFVVIGAVAALLPVMAEAPHFRIANAVYPCFTLSAILGSIARIFAYRRGFQPW